MAEGWGGWGGWGGGARRLAGGVAPGLVAGPAPCDLQEAVGHRLTWHRHRKAKLRRRKEIQYGCLRRPPPPQEAAPPPQEAAVLQSSNTPARSEHPAVSVPSVHVRVHKSHV